MTANSSPRSRLRLVVYGASAALAGLLCIPGLLDTALGRERPALREAFRVIPPAEAAAGLAAGKRFVFVDVREPEEYAEFHIPGAVSVPLRDVYTADLTGLHDADLVIPYCLKDFRGFEGARTLARRGLRNVGVIDGFGVKAWKRQGLPVAGDHPGLTDVQALAALVATFESGR